MGLLPLQVSAKKAAIPAGFVSTEAPDGPGRACGSLAGRLIGLARAQTAGDCRAVHVRGGAHCDATGEATDLNVLQHLVASDNKPRGNNIAATSSALNTALESSSSHCRVCSLRDAFDDAIAAP